MLKRTSPSRGPHSPTVTGFYEPDTGSIQYVLSCPTTHEAAIVDPVLGFDLAAARMQTETADAMVAHVREEGLAVVAILDTHPHADHVTASAYLADVFGAPNAIGEGVRGVADLWRTLYNDPAIDPAAHYDRLFADGDTVQVGALTGRVRHSPGHTLASISYVFDDAAFVHDTVMQPDFGTARADFPGGSADALYDTIQAILALPEPTRLFIGHDYGTQKREEPAWESTVAEQRASNVHVGGGVPREQFVALREKRDASLKLPRRMLAALQLNLRAGRPPEPEADGHSYLKIPLGRL